HPRDVPSREHRRRRQRTRYVTVFSPPSIAAEARLVSVNLTNARPTLALAQGDVKPGLTLTADLSPCMIWSAAGSEGLFSTVATRSGGASNGQPPGFLARRTHSPAPPPGPTSRSRVALRRLWLSAAVAGAAGTLSGVLSGDRAARGQDVDRVASAHAAPPRRVIKEPLLRASR